MNPKKKRLKEDAVKIRGDKQACEIMLGKTIRDTGRGETG